MKKLGRVFLIGAGPGDPELMTLKAHRMLGQAQAVVYDRLVSPEVLALAPPAARMVAVGKAPKSHPVPQSKINQMLVSLAWEGLTVVRLKGGDPFIFGRGSEEAQVLHEAGIPVEIAPGVTAAQGAAASTGVPLTHRGMARSVRYVTGHCRADTPLDLDWKGLTDPETTLVVYMGAANIREISEKLIAHGIAETLPVMTVANATTPRERLLISDLGSIAEDMCRDDFSGPVLFIIGNVVSLYRESPLAGLARCFPGKQLASAYA